MHDPKPSTAGGGGGGGVRSPPLPGSCRAPLRASLPLRSLPPLSSLAAAARAPLSLARPPPLSATWLGALGAAYPPIYAAINRQTSVGRLARALSLQSLLALLQFSRARASLVERAVITQCDHTGEFTLTHWRLPTDFNFTPPS